MEIKRTPYAPTTEIEPCWQDEDDWLCTVEFLPNDDLKGEFTTGGPARSQILDAIPCQPAQRSPGHRPSIANSSSQPVGLRRFLHLFRISAAPGAFLLVRCRAGFRILPLRL
jgi:hypothetical protein